MNGFPLKQIYKRPRMQVAASGGIVLCNPLGPKCRKAVQLYVQCWRCPAYARKLFGSISVIHCTGITPRVRGEKLMTLTCAFFRSGSPPRARGKVAPFPQQRCHLRITPAYAGKSDGRTVAPRRGKDHPRIRGEKEIDALAAAEGEGSPPHTRGKGLLQ